MIIFIFQNISIENVDKLDMITLKECKFIKIIEIENNLFVNEKLGT